MTNARESWQRYQDAELARATGILAGLGYELEPEQPHMAGERYLMQAVTTAAGPKLILIARRRSDGLRVVAKVSSNESGKREIAHERESRAFLENIRFAYDAFMAPPEIAYLETGGMTVFIQEFIEQEKPFLARPVAEQFGFALNAFKTQEGAHATTYGHRRAVERVFGRRSPEAYERCFLGFRHAVTARFPDLAPLFESGARALLEGRDAIEQYDGFLAHTDFVPHNFRIRGDDLYLLDLSSVRFGNKYEGWARFANFMALYNPDLEAALTKYVADNRAPEEARAFSLMRLYRLGELLLYYEGTLDRSEGDLRTLNESRIRFWSVVMKAHLEGRQVAPGVREAYERERDALRSSDEKRRQKDLH